MKSWIDVYKEGVLRPVLEPSTQCTARCPQCHRIDSQCGGLPKVDWLPIRIWNLDLFKKALPPNIIKNLPCVYICGTWGDINTCKDFPEMVDYVMKNSKARVLADTNGSTHTPAWWKRLSETGKERLILIFDVDGIDQEMHGKYRRGTSLQIILDNMKAASEGGCRVSTNTVVYKHNENYLSEIFKLTESYGAVPQHRVTPSDRYFDDQGRYIFVNEDGIDEVLEKMEREDYEGKRK